MKKNLIKSLSTLSLAFLLMGCSLLDDETDLVVDPPEETEVTEEEETDVVEEETDEETDEESDEEIDEVNQTLEAWLPRLNNVFYSYEGIGNEYASFTWTPQFNQENYYQVAKNNGGTEIVEIYEYHPDEIVQVFRRPETYFRDNFYSINDLDYYGEYQVNEVVLKKPIAVGTTWSTDEADYEITAVDAPIEVPAGNYETIEVTIQFDQSVIKRYYAKEVGLVYEWTETEAFEVESKLAEIETEIAERIPFTIYQADEQLVGLNRVDAELVLKTNDPARLALQKILTGEKEGYENISVLPEGTKINYLFLNNKNIVEVDLSSEYISNMNAGSSGESFYLSSLANTLAGYYGVEKVLLTIDGGIYESGHIILRKDEPLEFNDQIINE